MKWIPIRLEGLGDMHVDGATTFIETRNAAREGKSKV
jgi:hypothetical protein